MTETQSILLAQAARYPVMQPQDAVKLLHQSEFGPGHLIGEEAACLDALRREWESLDGGVSAAPACERIGGGYVRLHLRALRDRAQLRALGRLFLASANHAPRPSDAAEGMERRLAELQALTAAGRMPFSPEALADWLSGWDCKSGFPAVRHSARYRDAYRPAYRVVRSELLSCLEIAAAIERLLEGQARALVAIDGRCGSGKSTLAAQLAALYRCGVIEMDHFFLPLALRTEARLREPGGNIHYERFEREVVVGLRGGGAFTYRVFDCSRMDYHGARRIEPGPVALCEGSYSLHPRWAPLWDLGVFTTCSPAVQRERILRRSGPAMLERFDAEWIPLEERYFEAFGLPGRHALTLDTGAMTLNGEALLWPAAGVPTQS